MTPIQTAINIVGAAKTAQILDVKPPSVSKWTKGERPVPATHCPYIEDATDGQVRCEDLFPGVVWNRDDEGRAYSFTTQVRSPRFNGVNCDATTGERVDSTTPRKTA